MNAVSDMATTSVAAASGDVTTGDGPEGVFAAAQQQACDELADL